MLIRDADRLADENWAVLAIGQALIGEVSSNLLAVVFEILTGRLVVHFVLEVSSLEDLEWIEDDFGTELEAPWGDGWPDRIVAVETVVHTAPLEPRQRATFGREKRIVFAAKGWWAKSGGVAAGAPEISPMGAIGAALSGDVAAAELLAAFPHSELLESVDGWELVVTKFCVRRVVEGLLQRQVSAEDAQRWSSFIRRGYLDSGQAPIAPLRINYEPDDEDLIVEVVSRLDELGDLVDGEIDEVELRRFLDSL